MTEIARYTVGERISGWPVNSWNQIADFVEGPAGAPPQLELDEASGIIPVRNVSSVMIPKGGVMQPTGAMLSLDDANFAANLGPLVAVDVPTLSSGAESTYMIATQPIPQGLTGGGILMGAVWCRVNIRDATDKYAQVIDSDPEKLESTASGSRARIIAQEDGTGEVWALILLAPYRMRIRKGIINNTSGQTEIPAGGSGTVDVYVNGANTGEENTTNHDWVGALSGEAVTTDRRVVYAEFEDDNIFSLISADCEPVQAPAPPGHANNIDLVASASGTGQGGYNLGFPINRVTNLNASNNAVTLPDDFEQNDPCVIRNAFGSGGILTVWPDVGDEIDELTDDVAVTIAPGESFTFWLVEADHWVIS